VNKALLQPTSNREIGMAGYEIAYNGALGEDLKGALIVYLAAGTNPINAEQWASYTPPTGYSLNTPRMTWFNELKLLGSPYVPTGEITYITTSDGYTWESVAALQRSVYPYSGQVLSPQQVAYSMVTPPPGILLVDSNDKNHENVFYGTSGSHADQARLQFYISDPWGNIYILKSVNAANSTTELVAQAVASAVLPDGWTKLPPSYFINDTVFGPSYSAANDSIAHANEFRDSADSAWMQITWGASGMTLDAAAPGGLPIWAGQFGGNLLGSDNNDLIYGAQGGDIIFGGKGNDQIDGGSSINHSKYLGTFQQYAIQASSNGTATVTDTIANRDGADTLTRIQRLDFLDKMIAVDIGVSQNAGEAFRLYQTLNRIADESGLGYWMNKLDLGISLTSVAAEFMLSQEFKNIYSANSSNELFISQLYQNVLHRSADAEGLSYWSNEIATGHLTRSAVVAAIIDSNESFQQTAQLVASGIAYENYTG